MIVARFERLSTAGLLCACLAVGGIVLARDVPYRQSRRIMGTAVEIQAYHSNQRAVERAVTAALDEMDRVDRLLSNYRADSELSRMNHSAAKTPFSASIELYDFVRRCRSFFDETSGTFDPTVGPLVRAWGFFTSDPERPSPGEAAAAKTRSGFDKVRLDDATRLVSYAVEGVELDPGGIGKGYAVDRAAAVLRGAGITSALISAGGSTIYGLGHPPDREGWTVGVRDPAGASPFLRTVTLRDAAISTSGMSEKFVVVDGKRYGHIIDPRTGEPAEAMCQVTVVTPSATDSDALTKAAFLLPRESLVPMGSRRSGLHMLRIEGQCSDSPVIWITPWSNGIFQIPGGGKGAQSALLR